MKNNTDILADLSRLFNNVVAAQGDGPGGRGEERGENRDGSGFARTIGSKEREEGTLLDVKRDIVYSGSSSLVVFFSEVLNFNDVGSLFWHNGYYI